MPKAGSCFAEWAVALRDLLECGYQFDEQDNVRKALGRVSPVPLAGSWQ